MAPYRRNVLVGGVVLGALLILGWMLIQFGGNIVAPFAPATMKVRFIADRADGLSNGSAVTYRGVTVGRVEKVVRAEDQLRIFIDTALDKEPPLPANIRAVIRSTGLVGSGASIVLELTEAPPRGQLRQGQEVVAKFIGLDILPPEFADLARELREAVKELRESKLLDHVNLQVEKVGKLIDSVQSIIEDPKVRDDLRASLSNLRSATEKANQLAEDYSKLGSDLRQLSSTTSDAVVSLSKQTSARLEQVSKLLDQFQSIAEKVNKGQGTAGRADERSKALPEPG
jgi:ABC-type transporter Mla subunit MlaD